jgi:hypothetical protein
VQELSTKYESDFNLMVFAMFILGGFMAVNWEDQYAFLIFNVSLSGIVTSIIRAKLMSIFYQEPNDFVKHWINLFEGVQYAAILSFIICLLFSVGA